MATKDRSKRMEKKRARREKRLAKKQAFLRRSMPAGIPLMLALPKMSDTLVEFAAPLLDDLDETAGAAEWRSILFLGATIWNMARVAEQRREESGEAAAEAIRRDLVARLADATQRPLDECAAMVADLEQRKRQLFPDDPRQVVDLRTTDIADGVHVYAISRL